MPGYSPALLAAIKKHTKSNNNAAIYFAIAIGGLMGLLVIQYWLNVLLHRWKASGFVITRWIRSVLLRKVPLFNSVGHFLVFAVYLGINAFLIFWDLDHRQLTNLSRRMGWISSLNLSLLVFLALKNTPLAILTPYSYERLNIFHQLAGYTTVACVCVHAITFLYKFLGTPNESQLHEREQIYGMVAGGAMVATFLTALVIRHLRYELFYVIHVSMFIIIIVTLGMHRPDITTHTLIIVIVSASIWFLDRLARFLRISYHFLGTSVTVTPLPFNAVRLRFSSRTSLFRAQPGGHVFLWIPGVRAAEMHPFTLVSTDPLELVIAAQDGFTRDLREKAVREPGRRMRASVDGPYGVLPSWRVYDRLLLIAGGSGASFCVGIALEVVRRAVRVGGKGQDVSLIWIMRDEESLTWFSQELDELSASPHITIRIYVTRAPAASSSTTSLTPVTILTPNGVTIPGPTHAKSRSLTSTPIVTILTPTGPSHNKSRSLTSTSRTPLVTVLPAATMNKSLLNNQSASSPLSPSDTLGDLDQDLDYEKTPVSRKYSDFKRFESGHSSSSLDLEKSFSDSTLAVSTSNLSFSKDAGFKGASKGGREPSAAAATSLNIRSGRPEIKHLVTSFVGKKGANEGTGKRERVMVAACGPGGMMNEVRGAVAGVLVRASGDMDMHLEQFGW